MAAIRALAKTKLKKFNCFEITEVTIRRFLGIPYVSVVGHSRHVQEDSELESSARRGATDLGDCISARLE